MGGVVIILATVVGYAVANISAGRPPNASGLLLLFLIVGLGAIGFADDYIKISRQRSLGLRAIWKIIGQAAVGITFAVAALQFPNDNFRTPASTNISVVRDTSQIGRASCRERVKISVHGVLDIELRQRS